MSVTLQFPSERILGNYLKNHSETKNLVFIDTRIIDLAVSKFARQQKLKLNVQMGVMNALYAPNVELGLDDDTMIVICYNLTKALKDCAEGKKIPLIKYTQTT